jgi:DNA-binding beta-propeller fold protein YncE
MPVLIALALLSAACAAAPLATATATATDDVLIVLAKSGHQALFVDPASGETLAAVPTGKGPHEVAVRSDGRLAVVADYGTNEGGGFVPGHTLTVIDTVTRSVVRTLDLGEHTNPHGVQFLPDDRRVAVTTENSRSLLVVDVETGELEQVLGTDAATSHMVVLSPDGTRAFVANIAGGSVSAFDLERGELLGVIETGAGCEGIEVTPDGKSVWATNRAAGTISILDAKSLRVMGELSAPGFPIRVKITPDGSKAVVSCATSATVRVFDVRTRQELAAVPMDLDVVDDAGERLFGASMQGSTAPVGVLIAPDGSTAWIAATNGDVVVSLDLETLEISGGFPAGPEPDGLGFARIPREQPADEG